jgi:hypothetical protein
LRRLPSISLPSSKGIRQSQIAIVGYSFITGFAVSIVARALILAFFGPASDVFYYDKQAAQTLLAGANPYTHTFTAIPSALETPGAERVFAYLPFTAIYQIPFYLLGDIRLGFLVANAIIGLSLYMLGGKRSTLASLIFLLNPVTMIFSTIYLDNSLVSIAFLALFLAFDRWGNRFSAGVALGLSLASIQLAWILFPFLAYYLVRRGQTKVLAVSLLVFAAVLLPFAVWSFPDFISDTIFFQFSRPTLGVVTQTGPLGYSLNLSLNGFLQTLANFTLPSFVRVGAIAILLPFLMRRSKTLNDVLLRGGIFTLISIFVLPNNFFWVYTELPFVVFLAYISINSHTSTPMLKT